MTDPRGNCIKVNRTFDESKGLPPRLHGATSIWATPSAVLSAARIVSPLTPPRIIIDCSPAAGPATSRSAATAACATSGLRVGLPWRTRSVAANEARFWTFSGSLPPTSREHANAFDQQDPRESAMSAQGAPRSREGPTDRMAVGWLDEALDA